MPLVLGLIALAALAFLLVADPLGLMSGDTSDDGRGDGAVDLLASDGDGSSSKAPGKPRGASLASLYGDGKLGAIKLRLLWIGTRKPVSGQSVALLSRRGKPMVDLPSDSNGDVLFPSVRPAHGYSLSIKGEGFSEVLLRGISVYEHAVKDLGELLLGKDVVLRGRVVDATGRPVPGTSVSVHTIEREMAAKGMLFVMAEQAAAVPLPLTATRSDEEGYFAFSALDDGAYSLIARQSGYGSKLSGDVLVSRQRGADLLTIVLGTGAAAVGKVTDEEGKPIGGAQVIAVRDARRWSMNATNQMMQREVAETAEDGTYRLDTLTAGDRYRFGVIMEGYATVYNVQGVDVDPSGVQQDFVLQRGGQLNGVVTDEATGKPISNATIAVFVGKMAWGGTAGPEDKSNADTRRVNEQGEFSFTALTPGPVSSSVVRAPGYVTRQFMRWPPPGNMWPDVKAGETTEVQVEMKAGGSIEGVVKQSEGDAPIEGAEVVLMQTGWAAMGSMWGGAPTVMTSAEGAFRLEGIAPGKYRLMATAAGFSPAGGEEGVEVEIPQGGSGLRRDLELTSAGLITGVVLDPEGEVVAGARVKIREHRADSGNAQSQRRGQNMARRMMMAGRSPVDVSASSGKFRLEGVGTGTMWVVYAESDEYVTGESKPFKLDPGEAKAIELTMLPGGSLRGVVLGEKGVRLSGARVQVGYLTPEMAKQGRLTAWRARQALDPTVYVTDEDGGFLATNIKPGRVLVRASKDGYVTFYKRNLTIEPGEAVENYSVPLSRGEVIEGTVKNKEGRLLEGVYVAVSTQDDPGSDDADGGEASEDVEPMMFAITDARGRYKIENIKPRSYTLVIWFAPGYKSWRNGKDQAAIHRNVRIPGDEQDFDLNRLQPSAGAPGPGGR